MKTNTSLLNKRSGNGQTVFTRHRTGWFVPLTILLLLCGANGAVRASDPVGIYALIDKVVLAPDEKSPQTAQVWGVFSLAEGAGYTYAKPQRGYLFFALNSEKPDVTRKEWADLKSVAGTRQCIGFATRYPKKKPTIRQADEPPKNPDAYPLGWGIRKMKDKEYEPVRALLDAAPTTKSEEGKSKKNNP